MYGKEISLKRDLGVSNLSIKSKGELLDLLYRQNGILTNTKLLNSLPDRGEKIKKLKLQIEQALAQKTSQDQLATLFQRMHVSNGQSNGNHNSLLDSDDDEDTIENSEMILSADHVSTDESDSASKISTQDKEPVVYSRRLNQVKLIPSPGNFNTPKAKPEKEWFESAVTPPPTKHTQSVQLSISESIELFKRAQERHQELEQQAKVALSSRNDFKLEELGASFSDFQSFRDNIDKDTESEDSS